jgi:hypothetical protein
MAYAGGRKFTLAEIHEHHHTQRALKATLAPSPAQEGIDDDDGLAVPADSG